MSGVDLQPCPFCGATDNLRVVKVGSRLADMPDHPRKVVCRGLTCEDVSGPVEYGEYQAIIAWNRRSERDALAAERDRLREKVAEVRKSADGANALWMETSAALARACAERDALAARLAEVERERDAQKAKTDEWRKYCHETHDLLMASDEALATARAETAAAWEAGYAAAERDGCLSAIPHNTRSTPPADAAAAMDVRERATKAEGMREAALVVKPGMTVTQMERAILARAAEIEKGADQ